MISFIVSSGSVSINLSVSPQCKTIFPSGVNCSCISGLLKRSFVVNDMFSFLVFKPILLLKKFKVFHDKGFHFNGYHLIQDISKV